MSKPSLDLEQIRNEISDADARIFELIKQRCQLAIKAAAAKGSNSRDANREQLVLSQVEQLAKDSKLNREQVIKIYEAIMKLSRSQQR
jgi:chorismate mutase